MKPLDTKQQNNVINGQLGQRSESTKTWSMHPKELHRVVKGLIVNRQHFILQKPWPGSVVVERSPGMREIGGSIPGHVKQKTLKI